MKLGVQLALVAATVLVAAEARAGPDFEEEYESWFGPERYEPEYTRAAAEIGALMGAGLLYYWGDPLANSEDWDNPSIEDRATLRSLRFDTNLNTTNHLLHPTAGALVYTTARVNGLPVGAAFAYGLAQSTLWEFALEWREKASINDLVYTAIGGMPFGEALYHAGEYFNSAPDAGLPQEAAAWTLGFPRRIHRALDGDENPPVPLPSDDLGFSSAYAHRFAIGYEAAALSNEDGAEGMLHTIRLDTELIAMPRFLEPGTRSKTFFDGNFTEMHARFGIDDRVVEADFQARATLFGHYLQDIRVDEDGDVEGHALMLGVGPALRFQKSKWLGRADQLSTVHLPGPHVELWLREDALAARFGAEGFADFASLASLAYPGFVERFGGDGTKTVLQRQGYQYSFGTWVRARGDLAYGPLGLGGSVGYGSYGSIEGADRFQSRVTRDLHGTESVLEIEAHAAIHLGPVALGAGFRERRRESTLGPVDERRRDRDIHLSAGIVF